MSKYSTHKIKCSKCGKEFSEEIADSLNVSIDNDSLDKIRTFDAMTVVCPHCGKKIYYDHPILYNDMKNNFMVQYAPDTKTFNEFIESCEKMNNQFGALLGNTYKYRVVLGDYRVFVEKVEILTVGLNDVVVEAYKEIFYDNMDLENVGMIIFEFSEDFSKKRLVVYNSDSNKEPSYYGISDEVYNELDEKLKEEPYYDRAEDYVVDRRFILKMFDEDSDKEPVHEEMLQEFMQKEVELYHDEGVKLAKQGKYKEAVELLLPLAEAGFKSVQNDLGVVYERMKDYKNCVRWYKECGSDLALENLLAIYDNKKYDFEVEDYFAICDKLISHRKQKGYLYKSYIYQIDYKGVEDHKKAFEVLLEGLIYCEQKDRLVFELGYLLEKGIGHEVDNYKSHKCYEAILSTKSKTINATVNYNYALQCYQGRGCEKDVPKAIKYFEIAGEQNYPDAIEYLIEIYSSKEYKNEERLKYYKEKQ